MAIQITGTTALVTGANRGIGRALVEALLERGAARVYATARDPGGLAGLVARFGDRVVPLRLDVTRPDEIRAAAAQAGDVRVLINNAGILAKVGGEFTDPTWIESARREFEVNVLGAWSVTQAFAPILGRTPGGTVANISSVVGLAAFASAPSYSASKAALRSLTQATRAALGPHGTNVACIYPGPIDTDMAKPLEMEKASPASAANAILDGIEAGQDEIFPDPLSRQLGDLFFRDPKELERQFSTPAAASARN